MNRTALEVRHILYEVLDLLSEDTPFHFLEAAKRLEEAAGILRKRAVERRSRKRE